MKTERGKKRKGDVEALPQLKRMTMTMTKRNDGEDDSEEEGDCGDEEEEDENDEDDDDEEEEEEEVEEEEDSGRRGTKHRKTIANRSELVRRATKEPNSQNRFLTA